MLTPRSHLEGIVLAHLMTAYGLVHSLVVYVIPAMRSLHVQPSMPHTYPTVLHYVVNQMMSRLATVILESEQHVRKAPTLCSAVTEDCDDEASLAQGHPARLRWQPRKVLVRCKDLGAKLQESWYHLRRRGSPVMAQMHPAERSSGGPRTHEPDASVIKRQFSNVYMVSGALAAAVVASPASTCGE